MMIHIVYTSVACRLRLADSADFLFSPSLPSPVFVQTWWADVPSLKFGLTWRDLWVPSLGGPTRRTWRGCPCGGDLTRLGLCPGVPRLAGRRASPARLPGQGLILGDLSWWADVPRLREASSVSACVCRAWWADVPRLRGYLGRAT